MPYRINPQNKREVQVKRGGVWARKAIHVNAATARRHLAALQANVEEAQQPAPPPKKRTRKKTTK